MFILSRKVETRGCIWIRLLTNLRSVLFEIILEDMFWLKSQECFVYRLKIMSLDHCCSEILFPDYFVLKGGPENFQPWPYLRTRDQEIDVFLREGITPS